MKVSRLSLLALVLLVVAAGAGSQWWRLHQEQALGRALAQQARAGDISIISSDTCQACAAARGWLHRHGVAFTECSIERDVQCAARFHQLLAPGTPVVLVRGQPQLGFDARRVLESLKRPAGVISA